MDAIAWPQILAALLGGGGVGAIATAWLRARIVDRKTEARLVELENEREDAVRSAALSLVAEMRSQVREGREETGQHQLQYVDCERRCALLEGDNAKLRLRIGQLEAEVEALKSKVAGLLDDTLRAYVKPDPEPLRPTYVRPLLRDGKDS